MKLHRAIVSLVLALGVASMLYACADEGTSDMPELTTNAKIDLQRYMGAWYVIANIPYFAERGKVATRDVYKLDADGNVDTTYVYRKSFDGPEKTMGSLGVVQPGSDNARWVVRFLWLIRADYLILEVAPDYSWALVGQPNRKLAWVFARNPAMDDALYTTLLGKFRGFGYDTTKFMRVPQFKEQIGKPGFQ
jgi:apolipoprotein D and lipocalin family protein